MTGETKPASARPEWKTEKRKVADLIPYPKNPRLISEKMRGLLERSLERFGIVEPVVINIDNTIVAGHQRVAALKNLGRENDEIDVRVPGRKLTDEDFKDYNIWSNLIKGEWDADLLVAEIDEAHLLDLGFEKETIGLSSEHEITTGASLDPMLYVIVDCKTESEQKRVRDLLVRNGIQCRLST